MNRSQLLDQLSEAVAMAAAAKRQGHWHALPLLTSRIAGLRKMLANRALT
jgi:hypothetical protein